jgi:hypothetical protein
MEVQIIDPSKVVSGVAAIYPSEILPEENKVIPDTFFPRGVGPLVSVLLPTRKRVRGLVAAIDSLYSLAKNKSNLEFILKIDDDDAETIELFHKLQSILPVKSIISSRGNGYHDMHHWVNQMSALATGDWLFLFNDDALMGSQDWDEMLLYIGVHNWWGIPDICCISVETVNSPGSQEFMFLRRRVFELLGYYSLIPHNDTWIKTLMPMVSAFISFPLIQVVHQIKEYDDDVRREGIPARETTQYTVDNGPMKLRKLQDALKLQRYINKVRGQ